MGLASLQIQNSNNADVLIDSRLNLFDIIANLCSKLYYEVLLKSGNYIVNLLKQTLMFWTWIVRFGHPVWVHKLTDIVTSLCSELDKESIECDTYLESLNNINLE